MTAPEDPLYSELLALAVEVAHEAGELIRVGRAEGFRVTNTKSSVTDVVTDLDRASEQLIRERLLGARPGDGFLGEEGSADPSESGVRWVVDPIDGTVNFVSGFPQYAVSIAAEIDGVVVAGVVLHVPPGLAYTATLGGGAWRGAEPLGIPERKPLAQALVATGFNYDQRVRTNPGAGRGPFASRDRRHSSSGVVRPGPVPRR